MFPLSWARIAGALSLCLVSSQVHDIIVSEEGAVAGRPAIFPMHDTPKISHEEVANVGDRQRSQQASA